MPKHLVVGAGSVGTAVASLLAGLGNDVVVVSRSGSGPGGLGIRLEAADAASGPRMAELARGAAAIYNCVNPPYQRWVTDWPPIARSLLEAAQRSGAVLVTVGNLYGYGEVDGPMTEDLPLAPRGPKGRVRAQMWRDARDAHQAGRVRATEVRGSDYLAPGAGSHLGDRVMPRVLDGRPVRLLPSVDQPHTWTSVDDVAGLLVAVAADERAWGRPWHVPSNAPRTQREAVTDLARAAGYDEITVREHPVWLLRALALANPFLRELAEVAYQFERPFVLDSTAAQRTFGLAPTPWETVVERQVAHYRRAADRRAGTRPR